MNETPPRVIVHEGPRDTWGVGWTAWVEGRDFPLGCGLSATEALADLCEKLWERRAEGRNGRGKRHLTPDEIAAAWDEVKDLRDDIGD